MIRLASTLKLTLALATITGLFLAIGLIIGGPTGAVVAFGLALLMNVGSFWFSDSFVLRIHQAQPLERSQFPEVFAWNEEMSKKAKLPAPRLFVYESSLPNAFATGRSPQKAVVALSTGILDLLSPEELKGVLAHELAHIKNRDMVISTVAATLAGAIGLLGELAFWFGGFLSSDDEEGINPGALIALVIITPLITLLLQMALSRSREYVADATGAQLAGKASGLISALKKLHSFSTRNRATERPLQTAMSSLYIASNFSGRGVLNMFSTHPPVEKRVEKLEKVLIN